MTKDAIAQGAILASGGLAIWLVTGKERLRKWGPIVGILGQPFWLWATFRSGQWGMFALSVWYTGSWLQGIWNFWLKKEAA